MEIGLYVLAGLLAYLLGSIPTGFVIARLRGNVDLLQTGSRKTGATNVLRTMGWKAAAPVFGGDFLKGILAILVARLITHGDPIADVVAGLAVIAGHNYSVFIRFRGGRGVTTGLGTLVVIAPVVFAIAAVIGVTSIALSRYVSLGSVLGSCSVPVTLLISVFLMGQPFPHFLFGLVGAAFVVVSHRDNIVRLIQGTERKLGQRANS